MTSAYLEPLLTDLYSLATPLRHFSNAFYLVGCFTKNGNFLRKGLVGFIGGENQSIRENR
jgi:hypothetical protein